jgi:hypothetical protein
MNWLKEPDNGRSVTLTAFCVGFIVCLFKLVFSGVAIGNFKLAIFTGVDFGASITALGGIYSLKTHIDNLAKGNSND